MIQTVKQIAIGVLSVLVIACSKNNKDHSPSDKPKVYKQYTACVVPNPVSMIHNSSEMLKLSESKALTIGDGFSDREFEILKNYFKKRVDVDLTKSASNPSITCQKNAALAKEEYKLDITATGIAITSSTDLGRLWAVQTLRQIIDCAAYYQRDNAYYSLPALVISDKPKYEWRSMHTDISRHFFSKDYLKSVAEQLSYLKVNKFHLHLNDDQGWRIVVDAYPDLTAKGGYRDFDRFDLECIRQSQTNSDMIIDPKYVTPQNKYGGFFTKADMREIIEHAALYGVEIIPEIDMPGHLSAAQVGYPYLSCTGTTGWGSEFTYPMCIGNPLSREFYMKVYAEMADLFPSEYFHIGADEADPANWKSCPVCQQFLADNGQPADNVRWLQDYFVRDVREMLITKGKKVIVWDDALIANSGTMLNYMFWREWESGVPKQIVNQNSPLIWSCWDYFYLSNYDSGDRCFKGMYEFFPGSSQYAVDGSKFMGWTACIWTEYIPNEIRHQWYMFPAMFSFAEKAWGTDNRTFSKFFAGLSVQFYRMDKDKIKYRQPANY